MMRKSAAGLLLTGLMIAAGAHAEQPVSRAAPTARASPAPAPLPDPNYGLPGAPSERAFRARANLEALLQGRIFTSDLSPQELQDVIDFDRMVRGAATTDNRSTRQRCVDEEVRRNGGNPTRLAWEVIRMKCR